MRHKKGRGTLWMAAGLCLLLAALCLTIFNVWDGKRAEKEAQDTLKLLEAKMDTGIQTQQRKKNESDKNKKKISDKEEVPDYVLFPDMEMPVVKIDGEWYIGILEIPSLNLTLPVREQWSYENLRNTPCCFEGSVYQDNMVIAGHNYSGHFRNLRDLSIGDEIRFTDGEGNLFCYQVSNVEILEPDDVENMIQESEDWDLTLFTCTYGGQTRHTVRCIRKKDENVSQK